MSTEHTLEDLASACIRCGFCIESCPTFRISGVETDNPRGRIYLARSAATGVIDWKTANAGIDTCLGCRACEPACPSGVRYGELLELARAEIEQAVPNRQTRVIVDVLTRPLLASILIRGAKLLFGDQIPAFMNRILLGKSRSIAVPAVQTPYALPPLDPSLLPRIERRIAILDGCINRVLFSRVNEATRRLLRRVGADIVPIDLGCCGALHAHAGFRSDATGSADRIRKLCGDMPIIVNSAGCGSWLKEMLPPPSQVFDICEFLLQEGLQLQLATTRLPLRVAYQDACHLSNGQGIKTQPRQLLQAIRGIELVSMEDAEQCCGSAGIFNMLKPELAERIREKKLGAIEATRADVLATGNPGCYAWLARGLEGCMPVFHTAEILEFALSGIAPYSDNAE